MRSIQRMFHEILYETTWMNEEMKNFALYKLDNIITIMAYPDFIPDAKALNKFYENLRICKWDNYGNAQRLRAFRYAYQLSQLSTRDREL